MATIHFETRVFQPRWKRRFSVAGVVEVGTSWRSMKLTARVSGTPAREVCRRWARGSEDGACPVTPPITRSLSTAIWIEELVIPSVTLPGSETWTRNAAIEPGAGSVGPADE